MNAPLSTPNRRRSQFNAGSGRGELPLWAVLVVAIGVLALGVGGSSAGSTAALDADGGGGFAGGIPLAIEPDQLGDGGEAEQLLASASSLDDAMGLREAVGAEQEQPAGDGQSPQRPNPVPTPEGSSSGPDVAGDNLVVGGAERSSQQPWREGLREEGNFHQGVRHGLWKSWRDDGTLRTSGQYANGLREGTWESFSSSGALLSELGYAAGSRSGAWLAYSETGAILEDGQYSENVASGRWTTYYSGGRIKERGLFVNGLREGLWEFYDDLGLPTLEAGEYRAGIKVQ